jgi:sugar lactone lactonase YvrE
MKRLALVIGSLVLLGAAPNDCAGKARLIASIPPPASPEGVVVSGGRVYVSGPAKFGTAGQGPSALWAFDPLTRENVWRFDVRGEDLAAEHALSCVAADAQGRLYVLSTQLGVLRIDPSRDTQEQYAPPFPHLETTPPYLPALPNDLAFDAAGALYVSDSLQGALYRIPPGGGRVDVWFQDPRLATPFGPNGLRVDPTNRFVYFTLTTDVDGRSGRVYRLPRVDRPAAGDLEKVHVYEYGEGPDGLAFADSGRIYVALAYASQISVLSPEGVEQTRFSGPISDAIPFDGPANIAFSVPGVAFVTNHASTSQIVPHMVLFGLGVDERGGPLFKP